MLEAHFEGKNQENCDVFFKGFQVVLRHFKMRITKQTLH